MGIGSYADADLLPAFCDMFPTHNPTTGMAWTTGEGVELTPFEDSLGNKVIRIELRGKTRTMRLDTPELDSIPDLCAKVVVTLWAMKHPAPATGDTAGSL